MAAARTLLASALLALVSAAAALANAPTVRILPADQAKAEAALLRLKDFGVGWSGGPKKASKLTAPGCPGFDPKESDLIVTGHAEANFTLARALVTFNQDTQVLESAAAVQTDFARTIQPKLSDCLAYELRSGSKGQVIDVKVAKLALPRFGSVSASYRATLTIKSPPGGHLFKFVSDFIFFGQGRFEYSVNVLAPAVEGSQLLPFERGMVETLLRRGASGNVA